MSGYDQKEAHAAAILANLSASLLKVNSTQEDIDKVVLLAIRTANTFDKMYAKDYGPKA